MMTPMTASQGSALSSGLMSATLRNARALPGIGSGLPVVVRWLGRIDEIQYHPHLDAILVLSQVQNDSRTVGGIIGRTGRALLEYGGLRSNLACIRQRNFEKSLICSRAQSGLRL